MPRKRPPSLQDIADLAGVSRMTVSRALRNEPRCAEETKQRIREIADDLGYRPNPLIVARMELMRQRKPRRGVTIGIVYPGDDPEHVKTHSNSIHWMAGMRRRIEELGFQSDFFHIPQTAGSAGAKFRTLAYRQVDALCFLPFPKPDWHLDQELSPFACAAIGYTLCHPVLHRVISDHREGMLLALEKVREAGCERVGLILERFTSSRIGHRHLETFERCRQYEHHSDLLPPLVVEGPLSQPENRKAFLRWRKKHDPDVLISNLIDFPFLESVDIRVPEDVGFVSLDVRPDDMKVSGVNQLPERVGACLVDRVTSHMYCNERGTPTHPELTLVPPEWNEGTTLRGA